MDNLRELELSNLNLRTISSNVPEELFQLEKLEKINLTHNRLEKFEWKENELKSIKSLLLNDNRITFGKDSKSRPYLKTFLSEVQDGIVPATIWNYNEAGHNIGAKSELRDISCAHTNRCDQSITSSMTLFF